MSTHRRGRLRRAVQSSRVASHASKAHRGEDVVMAFGGLSRWRWSWQRYGERIVGLWKRIGEMGCPLFYNHAIL